MALAAVFSSKEQPADLEFLRFKRWGVKDGALSSLRFGLLVAALHLYGFSLLLNSDQQSLIEGGSQSEQLAADSWSVMQVSYFEALPDSLVEPDDEMKAPSPDVDKKELATKQEPAHLKNKTAAAKPKSKPEEPVVKEITKSQPQLRSEVKPSVNSSVVSQASNNSLQKQSSQSAIPDLVDQPSFALTPTAPVYPPLAKKRQQQGMVTLEVWINALGEKIKVAVVESSGFSLLDQAALTAANSWHFKPHKKNGAAINSRVLIPIHFSIQ